LWRGVRTDETSDGGMLEGAHDLDLILNQLQPFPCVHHVEIYVRVIKVIRVIRVIRVLRFVNLAERRFYR